MQLISIQSGSNGNSVYVETNGVKLLFDAGVSGKQLQQRLDAFGKSLFDIDGLIISHDHSDHVRCMGIYQRKFGMPIYITQKTLQAAMAYGTMGNLQDVRYFKAGERIEFGSVSIETIPTTHDAHDGVIFVVDNGLKRLGIMTDLGCVFDGLDQVMGSLDGVFLESNYDPKMLWTGSYPWNLKKRIEGRGGHISNYEAAKLLRESFSGGRLKWACLAHLSEENNHPDLALKTHREIVGQEFELHVAKRYEPTGIFVL